MLSPAAQEIIAEALAGARPGILAEGRAEMLLRLLRRKFGAVPAAVVERVRAVGIDQLDDWSERVLDARSLDEVFADDRPQ